MACLRVAGLEYLPFLTLPPLANCAPRSIAPSRRSDSGGGEEPMGGGRWRREQIAHAFNSRDPAPRQSATEQMLLRFDDNSKPLSSYELFKLWILAVLSRSGQVRLVLVLPAALRCVRLPNVGVDAAILRGRALQVVEKHGR